jgi:hypothetical protein
MTQQAPYRPVRIGSTSDLIYYWPVWLWGAICVALTWVAGEQITIDDKPEFFFRGSWLGLSFVFVLLFVIATVNFRARGLAALLVIFVIASIIAAVQYTIGLQVVGGAVNKLRIHINLATYAIFSCVILTLWIVAVYWHSKIQTCEFKANKTIYVSEVGGRAGDIACTTLIVVREPEDFFVHKLLGLPFLGTADFTVISEAGGSTKSRVFKNVRRPGQTHKRILEIIDKS